jgi:precorrin-8X/cobalt-precorrin-8 methylmutase
VTWRDVRYGSQQEAAADDSQAEAIQVLASRIDLSGLLPLTRAVTERVICTSGDLCYAKDLVSSEASLHAAVAALAAGAPVIADAPMVAAGITGRDVICKAGETLTRRLARTAGIPIAAAAVRLAIGEAGPGAIWVIGCEPVAIYEILARGARPALVIATPAGFVAAGEAKMTLRGSGVPALTNVSEKGGPAVAAAACMALAQLALAEPSTEQPVRR